MRSRTSEPGSISQKRARSKSGPSGGTTTLNRVTATVPLKSPIAKTSCCAAAAADNAGGKRGILADGRGLGGIDGRQSLGSVRVLRRGRIRSRRGCRSRRIGHRSLVGGGGD